MLIPPLFPDGLLQGLLNIGLDILNVFDANGEPDVIFGYTGFALFCRR